MDLAQEKQIRSVKEIESIDMSLEMLQDLGQGTFARVFKAKKLQTGEIVAVKQIQVPLLQRQMALKQVQNLQRIENDHIVTYHNSIYDLTDRTLNVIMQLCKSSLRKQIKQKKYSQSELVDFLVQMVSAFLQLSDKKLMHLDLKPQNILISQAHSGYYKVCDFGCSQIAIKSKLSKYDNHVFGTFNYLAPQNYLNYKGRFTSTSADVWSLGIVFYEMIYKVLPFKVDNDGLILRKEIEIYFKDQKHIQYPATTDCSNSIINILKLMLNTDPKKRITWRQLQKWLIAEHKVEEYNFMNVRRIYFKHITTIKIFLTIIIICRKNIEFNPHPFWKRQTQLLTQLSQTLIHLCYVYCIKFNTIYKYKIHAKLEPGLRERLVFAQKNIQYEQKLISERQKKKIVGVNEIQIYEQILIEKVTKLNEKLQQIGDECWQAMRDLQSFCSETLKCAGVRKTLFASGDDTYYGNSISGLNITS